jgi:hypothetical protein
LGFIRNKPKSLTEKNWKNNLYLNN